MASHSLQRCCWVHPINDFFEVKPLYQLAIDPLVLGWRYYWTDISDVVNENFTPTYFFYGKNDLYMQRMCYSQQGPLLERKLPGERGCL